MRDYIDGTVISGGVLYPQNSDQDTSIGLVDDNGPGRRISVTVSRAHTIPDVKSGSACRISGGGLHWDSEMNLHRAHDPKIVLLTEVEVPVSAVQPGDSLVLASLNKRLVEDAVISQEEADERNTGDYTHSVIDEVSDAGDGTVNIGFEFGDAILPNTSVLAVVRPVSEAQAAS